MPYLSQGLASDIKQTFISFNSIQNNTLLRYDTQYTVTIEYSSILNALSMYNNNYKNQAFRCENTIKQMNM